MQLLLLLLLLVLVLTEFQAGKAETVTLILLIDGPSSPRGFIFTTDSAAVRIFSFRKFLSTVNLPLWRYLSYKIEICHMAVAVEAAAASCISNVAPIQVEALQNLISARMPLKSKMCQAAVADSLAVLLWCLLGAVCFLLECMWAAT